MNRKLPPFLALAAVLAALLLGAPPARSAEGAGADEALAVRHYRPLEAARIRVRLAPADGASESPEAATAGLLRESWARFDASDWEGAAEGFLRCIERDPRNRSAREGLAMSLYRSGDSESAHRIAGALASVGVDSVGGLVAESVFAEVRELVARDDPEGARALLARFPESDRAFDESRDYLESAERAERAAAERDS